MNREEYQRFVNELKNAEKIEFNDFENAKTFEGCLPVEVLALRGDETLSFGPLKPVGLLDPKTNRQPHAVVQLRAENINKSMYNLVGFQTRLKWKEQERIFRMIPGLENAEFLRYGVMHKNTYLNLAQIINKEKYCLKNNKNIYFAGQITGVEGYIESAASGLFTAYSLWAALNAKEIYFPENTITGALQKYTVTENKNYQPMPSNFGLLNQEIFNEKGKKLKGRDKKQRLAEIALKSIKDFKVKNFKKLLTIFIDMKNKKLTILFLICFIINNSIQSIPRHYSLERKKLLKEYASLSCKIDSLYYGLEYFIDNLSPIEWFINKIPVKKEKYLKINSDNTYSISDPLNAMVGSFWGQQARFSYSGKLFILYDNKAMPVFYDKDNYLDSRKFIKNMEEL